MDKRLIVEGILRSDLSEYENVSDLFDMSVSFLDDDRSYAFELSGKVREISSQYFTDEWDDLYWRTYLFESPYLFESFLYYMEKNRPYERRFYQPRDKTLRVVVSDLQDLEDDKLEFYGLSMPPRCGKSTLCIFFLCWVMGRRPNSHNAMSGHSGILATGFYKEVLNLTTTAEYTFQEIFPDCKLQNRSAELLEINFDKPDRFATLTCRGIDGTWTGAVDISSDGYLYVDDMVRDRTESMSPKRMEGRWQDYLNVLVDRKQDGAKELSVATRWSIEDIIGRLTVKYSNNPRYRFRSIAALDENGESNFQYTVNGFSTQYYLDVKSKLDDNEWQAKYQQRPYKREGLLFPENELRYYNGVLPDGEIMRHVTACDVAWGGSDSLSMPFGVVYGNGDVFIHDWIFNIGDKTVTKPIVVGRMMHHKPHQAQFEADGGGHMYADDINRMLQEKNVRINITSRRASNQMSKQAKIIQYAPDIKNRFVFLSPEYRSKEYQKAMDELYMYTQIGKNPHDDAPDGLTQLAILIDQSGLASIEVMEKRPW